MTPPDPASRICITTAGRPAALERCLERLADDAERFEDRVLITVHDNSGKPSDERLNRNACRRLDRRAARIVHCGERWRRTAAARLAVIGIEKPVVEFALRGSADPRTGANRNAVLLSAAGSKLLMLDDDVIPRVWSPSEARAGVSLTDETDPRGFHFAGVPAGLTCGLVTRPEPLWRSHAALIGSTVAMHLQRQAVTAIPPGWRASARAGDDLLRRGRIRATLHGVVGDCGMGWLRRWLLLEGPSRAALVDDRQVYDASCASGLATRTSDGVQLSASGNGAIGGFGIDASELVPPFLPSYRCSDSLFLILLKRMHGDSVVAFLPQAIEHWPLRDRSGTRGAIWESTGLRVWDVVRAVVSTACSEAGGTPAERLHAAGRAIHDAATASTSDFRSVLESIWRQHASAWLIATERVLATHHGTPVWWADDVRRLRGKLIADSTRPDAGLPRELGAADIPGFQRTLALAGKLYQAWPAMWNSART